MRAGALVTAHAPHVKYLRLIATDDKGHVRFINPFLERPAAPENRAPPACGHTRACVQSSPPVSLDGAHMHSAAVAGRSVKYAVRYR